jgi:hypothetical protein
MEALAAFICGVSPILYIVIYNKCLSRKFGKEFSKKDPMNVLLISYGKIRIGFWSISHFFYYLLCTYCSRDKEIVIFLTGIGWEVLEDIISVYVKKKEFGKKHGRRLMGSETIHYTDWWSGSVLDIVVNTFGIATGYILRIYDTWISTFLVFAIMSWYTFWVNEVAKYVQTNDGGNRILKLFSLFIVLGLCFGIKIFESKSVYYVSAILPFLSSVLLRKSVLEIFFN